MTATKPAIRRVDTARGHYYIDETGARVPGVTTIIGDGIPKPALINWAAEATADYAVNEWDALSDMPPATRVKTLYKARYAVKDAAANKGTAVHSFGEELAHGREVVVPDELAGYVEAYARFLDEHEVEPVAVEFSVFHPEQRYAGTADLCADLTVEGRRVRGLLDIKTNRSGIFGETALQIAAYRYAPKWVLADGKEIDRLDVEWTGAIHVRGDGYSLIPVTAGPDEYRAFLYAQQVAQWTKTSRDLVGDPVISPEASAYRLVRSQS